MKYRRQSAIGNRQSAIGNRQSAIGNRQSAIGNEFRAAQDRLLILKLARLFTIHDCRFTK
jgi:hypothetical protein